MSVTLREITPENRAAVEAMVVSPLQVNFVDSVIDSLDEADRTPQAMPRHWAIYAGEEPVGFVMISDNIPPGDPTLVGPYYLWRLLIDHRYQGRGYGRAALRLVVDYVRGRPGAVEFLTSVAPGTDGSPLGFYLNFGFTATDEYIDGERLLRLSLH